MSLTEAQRIQISGEMVDLPLKVETLADTQIQLVDVKADLQAKDDSLKIFFDKYNNIANAYQDERRWIDGTTYTQIVDNDLHDAAQKKDGNLFFPTDGSWINFQPQKHNKSEGLPTSSSPDSEQVKTTELLALIDLIKNGQYSVVLGDTLAVDYIAGSGTMEVTTGGQTIGNLILVDDGVNGGLFLIEDITTVTTLTVTEIIPPASDILATADVIENIPGYSNGQRNSLSGPYSYFLNDLANNIKTSVDDWETTLNSQLTNLNANTDSRSPQAVQITAAIADVNNALSVVTNWKALPDIGTTGTDSKFVDVNLDSLSNEVSARSTFSSTRNGEITTALGSISQASNGTYSGSGIYFERFNQINSRINLAGGPLTEYYEKNMAEAAIQQMVDTANSTLSTYETELRMEVITANPNGTNTIAVTSTSGFSIGNTVYVMADTLTELTGTITNISGLNIILSFTVPNTYTTNLRARIYKQL